MSTSAPNYFFCDSCTFIPFCTSMEKSHHSTNQINPIVKQYYHLKPKEILCLSKNKFQNIYAIQQGALKSYEVEAGGKELIRQFYFAGEIFGYEAIFTGYYPFSVVALSETTLCEIPYENFLELLQSKPALQKHVLYLISQRLNVGSYLASTTAEQRLAAFLIDIFARLSPLETRLEFILPMSRQDIGSYLRLTAETVSRLLSRFQKNNVIKINHKEIHYLELEKLKQLADGLLLL